MLKKLYTCVLWVIACSYCNAQVNALKSDTEEQVLRLLPSAHIEAITSINKKVENLEKNKDTLNLVLSYLEIAYRYNLLENTKNAEHNFSTAMSLIDNHNWPIIPSKIHQAIGSYYSYSNHPDIPKALQHYKIALKKVKEQKDTLQTVLNSMHIAKLYARHLRDGTTARKYLKPVNMALEQGKKLPDHIGIYYEAILGVYFMEKLDYDQAIDKFNTAIHRSETKKYIEPVSEFYLLKANSFEILGEKDSALTAYKIYNKLRDKIINKENVKQSELLSIKFEQKQMQNHLNRAEELNQAYRQNAKKSKMFIVATILAIIALSFLIIILVRNYKMTRKFNKRLKQQNEMLKVAKKKTDKLARLKSNFINTVSHELRTPLYAVTGITSILLENPKIYQQNKEHLDSLNLSSEYLLQLINNVLQINKLEMNKMQKQKVTFNLQLSLDNLKHSLEPIQNKNNNVIIFEVDSNIPENIKGDKMAFQKILYNLVGNALKFTRDGTVRLHIGKQDKGNSKFSLILMVKDNGIGIPKEHIKTIFDEFSQVVNGSSSFEGTGLGLSIVKKLVSMLKGEISVSSKVGVGTKFILQLPFEKGKPLEHFAVKKKKNMNLPTTSILVVDDNKVNRMVTKNVLIKDGFKVEECCNGQEAVEAVRNKYFNLVLMDLDMPVMDGFKASLKIREFNNLIPIIALTASCSSRLKNKVKSSGMDDMIIKPYDKIDFFNSILKHLESGHQKTKFVKEPMTNKEIKSLKMKAS